MLLKNADIEQVLTEDLNAYKQQHLKYFEDCRAHQDKIYNAVYYTKPEDFFKNL
jgi:hypothetical protein